MGVRSRQTPTHKASSAIQRTVQRDEPGCGDWPYSGFGWVIRQTGVGRFYYKRVGLQNGLSVEIDDPVQTEATFVATNNGVQHSPSPTARIITQGSTVLSNEPMLEYWSA